MGLRHNFPRIAQSRDPVHATGATRRNNLHYSTRLPRLEPTTGIEPGYTRPYQGSCSTDLELREADSMERVVVNRTHVITWKAEGSTIELHP